ncbi:hypothetical protein LCGC14_0878370 [marine sediment metagenome]|uniref:Uncharacterized protein n=1 Tax=marine sediment metagenome TaxID=412755 RepID=A0A0F9PNA6_9ZZZZ
MNESTISDRDLLGIDLFADDKDDAGARLSSSRMVTTQKAHACRFSSTAHDIPVGARARVESAIMDDRWGRFSVCRDCLEGWFRETEVPLP